jgi:hypothetical protein
VHPRQRKAILLTKDCATKDCASFDPTPWPRLTFRCHIMRSRLRLARSLSRCSGLPPWGRIGTAESRRAMR